MPLSFSRLLAWIGLLLLPAAAQADSAAVMHPVAEAYVKLALAAGVHPKVVSERLGHASVVITLDTYSHAIPALQETAAELVASLVLDS